MAAFVELSEMKSSGKLLDAQLHLTFKEAVQIFNLHIEVGR